MNIILTLSLKGSCMVAGYYLMCLFMGKSFSHRMRYLWLKFSILGYLLPLLWLRDEIAYRLQNKFGIRLTKLDTYVDFGNEKAIFRGQNGMLYPSPVLQKELLFVSFWFGIAFALLVFLLIRMRRFYRILSQNSEAVSEGRIYDKLSQTQKDFRLRKRAKLHLVDENYWCSGGLFSPFIVMKKDTEAEAAYILRHELMHIRRKDSLFKALLYLAVCIHWFNPFVYLLKWQMERECEMSCDDRALEDCSQEEREEYALMLVKHSLMERAEVPLAALNLEKSKKQLKERINNIMDKKEKNMGKSIVCAVLMAVILVGSSFTVLAYDYVPIRQDENVPDTTWPWDYPLQDMEYYDDDEEIPFLAEIPPIVYDEQFIDEDGNIYEITDIAQTYAICVHQYKSGKAIRHTKYQDGSCDYIIYWAQRCTKCDITVLGDVYSTQHYPVCPH